MFCHDIDAKHMLEEAIEITGLSYRYPDGTKALDNVSLNVLKGETLGIIGHNGAGKSTLILHLNGILRGSGSIKIFGDELSDKNIHEIRKKVGIVFQNPDDQLFMPTVFDDVAFGPINLKLSKEMILSAVDSALGQIDMIGFKERSAHHLSLGEKKRVSIATILSMEPDIIVFDEPSANLDPRHREELIKLINGLEHTKVIASHDMDLVRRCCTRIATIEEGRVTAIHQNA